LSAPLRRVLLSGLVAGVLLFIFFRGMDFSSLLSAFGSAKTPYLVGVLLGTLVTYALRAWRWGFLLAPLARVPFRRLFSVTWIGFMAGLLIPRAGEVVRPYLIARGHSLKTSGCFASIVLERIVDLLTVLLLVGAYAYVLPLPAEQTQGPVLGMLKVGGGLAGLGALAVLGFLIYLKMREASALRILDWFAGLLPSRFSGPVKSALRAFTEGLAVLRASPKHLLAIMGQSVLLWLSISVTFYWNNLAFGVNLPFHATFLLIGFLTVGVAVPTPGMVGGFHEAYLLALTQAFAIDRNTAAAVAMAGHALSNLPVLVLGLFFLGREGLTVSRMAHIADESARPEEDREVDALTSAAPPGAEGRSL